ncbi:MAG TPA: N-formylglutamate amidohydrolase [Polyangia bacterium]|nr:N-formylglutamate amidohydrolase [Polyangia bacterium]
MTSDLSPATLLGQDEPPADEVAGRDGRSPFLFICDHAGRRLPRALGNLGLSEAELAMHIAWDIGARGVALQLAAALDAFVVCQRYSRLVIDCNRPLGAVDSIATISERILIPGNQGVAPRDAEARAREIFHPYHQQIGAELDRRSAVGRPTILVAVHSFTPVFLDIPRPWHAGVLYNRDARLANPLLELLRAEGDLVVGCNQPYAANDLCDFSVVHHGEARGIPQVEIEIRQDLIADEAGQTAWAARLARLLPLASQPLFESSATQARRG